MTYKLICPNCDTYTSAVFRAYEDGLPCPHCHEPIIDGDGRTARSFYRQLPDDHERLTTDEIVEALKTNRHLT